MMVFDIKFFDQIKFNKTNFRILEGRNRIGIGGVFEKGE
jgi:hypothetical protein